MALSMYTGAQVGTAKMVRIITKEDAVNIPDEVLTEAVAASNMLIKRLVGPWAEVE